MANKNYDEQIRTLMESYGNDAFVKIYQALKIGKMKFSFVSTKDPKNNFADYYMDAHYFATQFMPLLRGGAAGWDAKKDYWDASKCPLIQMVLAEKERAEKAGDKYGKAVWTGPVTKKGDVTYNFTIEPSTKYLFVFHLSYGKNNFIVPVTKNDLIDLIVRWAYLYEDYDACMRSTYSIEGMKNPYFNDAKEQERATEKGDKTDVPKGNQNSNSQGAKSSSPTKYGVSSSKQELPKSEKTEEPKAQDETPKNNSESEVKSFKLKTTTALQNHNGCTYLKANSVTNESFVVFFDQIVASKAWEEFDNYFSVAGRIFTCQGIVRKNAKNEPQLFVTSISRN